MTDGDLKQRRSPPARSGTTLVGVPVPATEARSDPSAAAAPQPGHGQPQRANSEPSLALEWSSESHLAVDFDGPPLKLPDELEVEEPSAPSESAPLTLELDELDEGKDALGLVAHSRRSQPGIDLASEMAERFALDDFTGALRFAELVLGKLPEHPDARRVATESRRRLEHLYTSRLGGLGRVPSVAMRDADLRWLGLDHRAGFLLSRVEAGNSIEDLVDVSGMPRLEALKTLVELFEVGAIRFADE